MRFPSLALTVGFLTLGQPVAQAQEIAGRLQALEPWLPAIMDSAGVPGLALAVFEHGRLVAARGYGVRNARSREPVDTATVFEAMSLTKQVVAYTIMRLVERGVLELDQPLHQYLPYPDIADDDRYRLITARMVLSHRSGFPNWRPRPNGKLTIQFQPGTRFQYSGEGFVYLGKVAERLTGLPLPELVRREVFVPLGMTSSSMIWEERFAGNVAQGHRTDGGPMRKNKPDSANAAASLHTTAPDYARFILALLEPRGLTPATVSTMLTPAVTVAPGVEWGLGFGLQSTGGRRAFFQWGDNGNFKGYLLIDPDQKSGLVFFANSENGMAIRQVLLDRLLGGDHPATQWNRYEQYDQPTRLTRLDLERTLQQGGGIAAMLARYDELKRTRGPDSFDDQVLNTLGYQLMRGRRLKDAITVFELNVKEYPNAFNPYDSLGEAYLEDGQLELALRNYEKSVELNPGNTGAVAAIGRIRDRMK
jgi:CubicO group peptidase (beta-lactamase class C family)